MARQPSARRLPRSSAEGPRRSGSAATTWCSRRSTLSSARRRPAGVPVFSSVPGCAARGTLFDLGADYVRVGQSIGRLAGRVLVGRVARGHAHSLRGPARVLDQPRRARGRMRGEWSIPPEIDAKADVVVENGKPVRRHRLEELATPAAAPSRPSRTWKIGSGSLQRYEQHRRSTGRIPAGSQGGRPERRPGLHD